MPSILSLLPNSQYSSTRELIARTQEKFPKHWFYKPVGIEVEITNLCNLKCAGCGQRDETIRPLDILQTDEYIDTLLQAAEVGLIACSITGGETLMFLERVKKIIASLDGKIDIFKLNSNSYRFFNSAATLQVLSELSDAGFGKQNRQIKSVFVTSIGQQNEDGMPLKNSVHLVSNFYKIFDFDQAIVTVNATDKNIHKSRNWNKKFKELYKELNGHDVDENFVPFRAFMLNNIPTLERLRMVIDYKVPIKDLIYSFKNDFKSWKCLNLLPDDVNVTPTLTPRCILRPNGDVYACPGYNYTHKIGNVKNDNLKKILEDANSNQFLKVVFTEGLPGLLEFVKKQQPDIEKTQLSISSGPCDVCQFLKKVSTPIK